jgi:hypothetical protein
MLPSSDLFTVDCFPLQTLINYGRKKFYNIGPRYQSYKPFHSPFTNRRHKPECLKPIRPQRERGYNRMPIDNEGESAASFCLHVAALLSDIFCNFYLEKNHKSAHNSTTTKARDLESLEFF